MQLVPALLGNEVARGPAATTAAADASAEPPQPKLVAISGKDQSGQMTLVHAAARREASGCVHLILVNNANRPAQATVSFELGTPGIFTTVGERSFGVTPFEKSDLEFASNRSVVNGTLSEWLPSWGTQVIRFNGTSSCAASTLTTAEGGNAASAAANSDLFIAPGNLVSNPSFENSASYVAAPDGWGCDITAASQDRMCFADASTAKHGRRSGRFISGSNSGSFRIAVPVEIEANRSLYNFSAWLRGDCSGQAITLKIVPREAGDEGAYLGSKSSAISSDPIGNREVDALTVRADTAWTKMSASITLEKGWTLAFAVSKPGAIMIDDVVLMVA
jgi:hypothetical protein